MSKSKYYIERNSKDFMKDDNSSGSDQTDSDVIRCICDDTSDDGFTIQCEKCEDWQHASCVNIKKSKIPDHYICERCTKKQKRLSTDVRRHSISDNDFHDKKKKNLLKRNNKRVYMEDSDENDEPPKISRKKFTPLSKSVFKEKLVEDLLFEVHRQWIELNRPKSTSGKVEPKAILNKGLESIVVMESNLLLPAIPKASVKPIRKSLRGSYFQNQKDPSVEKGIFADIHIPEHRYLMEVTGELLRKSEYKNNAENKFSLLGTPLAHVFFYRSIDICVDARYAGNDTRHIRRSCSPNSEIKCIILPNDSDDQTIHMGIYTSEEVARGEEITIGWNWHRGLLMWHKNKEFLRNNYKVDIDASERKTLKKTLKLLMDEYGDCACEDKSECLIEYLKDELDKRDNDEGSSFKKRRPIIGKPRAAEKKPDVKKSRLGGIFTDDEDDESSKSRRSSIKEEKPLPYINKNTSKKKSTPIPSSPAVSVTESIDIDIMSMSPAPSEAESEMTCSKRIRRLSTSDIQLPCKKKWLREYMSQQQQLKATLAQSSSAQKTPMKEEIPVDIPSQPMIEKEEEDGSIDVDGELSDVASSESTLPLEDTPVISHNEPLVIQPDIENPNTEQNVSTEIEDVQPDPSTTTVQDIKPTTMGEAHPTETKDIQPSNEIQDTQPESSIKVEQTEDKKTEQVNKTDDPKPAPRKLTLQEYLSMRRGNLPTPDDKPPAE